MGGGGGPRRTVLYNLPHHSPWYSMRNYFHFQHLNSSSHHAGRPITALVCVCVCVCVFVCVCVCVCDLRLEVFLHSTLSEYLEGRTMAATHLHSAQLFLGQRTPASSYTISTCRLVTASDGWLPSNHYHIGGLLITATS